MVQDAAAALLAIAERFAGRMEARLDMLRAAAASDRGPLGTLRREAHQIAGVAGCVGFPRCGEAAAALEALTLAPSPPDEAAARAAIEAIAEAFAAERAALAAAPATNPDRGSLA